MADIAQHILINILHLIKIIVMTTHIHINIIDSNQCKYVYQAFFVMCISVKVYYILFNITRVGFRIVCSPVSDRDIDYRCYPQNIYNFCFCQIRKSVEKKKKNCSDSCPTETKCISINTIPIKVFNQGQVYLYRKLQKVSKVFQTHYRTTVSTRANFYIQVLPCV